MASDPRLEKTVDQILTQTEHENLESLKTTVDEAQNTLSKSGKSLEQEYDRILDEAKKESEKIEKKIIGSSDLDSRNKQLLLVEDSVEKVFDKAIEKINSTKRNGNYSKLIKSLLDESISALGTSDVTVYTNSKDKDVVNSVVSKISGAKLASETIECLGGVKVKSKDGTMTYNNTLDARIERMKPLIRKEIATKFGLGV